MLEGVRALRAPFGTCAHRIDHARTPGLLDASPRHVLSFARLYVTVRTRSGTRAIHYYYHYHHHYYTTTTPLLLPTYHILHHYTTATVLLVTTACCVLRAPLPVSCTEKLFCLVCLVSSYLCEVCVNYN